jgi:oligopeptidase B
MVPSADATPPPPAFGEAEAPVAERRPAVRVRHGIEDPDDLAWLRDVEDPEVMALLEAEAAHAEAVLAPLAPIVDRLYEEIRRRTKEDDTSVPYRRGAWWYRVRTEEGASYPIIERTPDRGDGLGPDPDAETRVILDENALAEGHDHLGIGVAEVSPDGDLLAYSVDFDGSESYELRVRDLTTGDDLPVAIPGTSYGFGWAADGECFAYTTLDPSQRPWRVHLHNLGADPRGADDSLLLQEDDDRFWVGVGASRSGDLIVVEVASAVTGEVHLIDAHAPAGGAQLAIPRRQGIEVQVAHHGDWLYLVSNDEALDFALWRAPVAAPDRARWQPVLPHQPGTRIAGVEAFASHLVVHLRTGGRPGLRIIDAAAIEAGPDDQPPAPEVVAAASRDLTFPDAGYTLSGGANEEWTTTRYRFGYESLVTPPTVLEEDLATGDRVVLKQMPVLDGFAPDQYETAQTWAAAPDGTRVPVSLAYRSGREPDGEGPLLLYGYGAYEISMDPWFSIPRLSLLDRGVVFAIAHVRGGGEMGRAWYEDGKELAKPNSFSDLVAAADHLVAEGWAAPDRIAVRGGSAGGLLVGAAANLAPGRFRAVVAEVPFVDALNTILDPEAPLTATEWEEWGNPITDAAVFRVMRSYAPTENVGEGPYPAILATGGLHDPRVGVHEPLVWVQRLRDLTDTAPDRPVVLQVEMGSGHGGPSGRYDAWRKQAEVMAFVLAALDVPEPAEA